MQFRDTELEVAEVKNVELLFWSDQDGQDQD